MNLEGYGLASREYVMAPHLNASNRLYGGQLMAWLDTAGAMVARQHMKTKNIVTKKFGEIVFDAPGLIGDIIEIWYKVTKEGNTSLTLDCVAVVHRDDDELVMICHCEVVFVALDENGRPTPWKK